MLILHVVGNIIKYGIAVACNCILLIQAALLLAK